MEGLAASVAMHRCHDLWIRVLLKAAFRQPTGCLATAAFIVIGIGARRERIWPVVCAGFNVEVWGSNVSQKLEWVEKQKAILCRDWPGASFSPTHPTILRLRQWAFACTKELFPFRRQLFQKAHQHGDNVKSVAEGGCPVGWTTKWTESSAYGSCAEAIQHLASTWYALGRTTSSMPCIKRF